MRDLGKIRLDLIDPNPQNRVITRASAEAMAHALEAQGQLSAVIVRPTGEGRYLLQAGHRRRAGALLLGWVEINASEVESEDDSLIGLIENGAREDLPPWLLCKSVSDLAERYDVATLANCIGKSRSHTDNLRRTWEQLSPDVRAVFEAEGHRAKLVDWIALAGRPHAVQRAIKIEGKRVRIPRENVSKRRAVREVKRKLVDLEPSDIRYQTLAWVEGRGPWPTREK